MPHDALTAQSAPPESLREHVHRLDSLRDVAENLSNGAHDPDDPAQPQQLRPAGVVKRGRGRPRKLVGGDGSRNGVDASAHAERVTRENWLAAVKTQLEKADGLTDGSLPVKLAQAVALKADSMPIVDLVSAFEKCENMALKLKAAKFLKDTSKGTMEELRSYAAKLMEGEADETTG